MPSTQTEQVTMRNLGTYCGLKLVRRLEVIWRYRHCQVPGHALQLPLVFPPSLQSTEAMGLCVTNV